MRKYVWFVAVKPSVPAFILFSMFAFNYAQAGTLPFISYADGGQAHPTPTVSSSPSAPLQATGIASNGMKYTDMEKMSPEEMNKLSPQLQEELESWMTKQIEQWKATMVSLDGDIKKLDEALVQKSSIKEQNADILVSMDQWIQQKKEVVVSLDADLAKMDERLRNSPEALLVKSYVEKASTWSISKSDIPKNVQDSLAQIASLTPPPGFILECQKACDALGIEYKKKEV